jgi:hypothetical protein
MRWVGRLMTSVAAVVLTTGGASAALETTANPVDTAWAETVKRGTLEAYAAFAMTFPESEHAQTAYSRLSTVVARLEAPVDDGQNDEVKSLGIMSWMLVV